MKKYCLTITPAVRSKNNINEKKKNITGTRVFIHRKKNNKGKIEIEYYSRDDLDRIIDLFESIR